VGLEVPTAVTVKCVFLNVTPCRFVEVYGGLLVACKSYSLTPRMEALRCSDMSVNFYKTRRHQIPDDSKALCAVILMFSPFQGPARPESFQQHGRRVATANGKAHSRHTVAVSLVPAVHGSYPAHTITPRFKVKFKLFGKVAVWH
jgi:hypothetical protein